MAARSTTSCTTPTPPAPRTPRSVTRSWQTTSHRPTLASNKTAYITPGPLGTADTSIGGFDLVRASAAARRGPSRDGADERPAARPRGPGGQRRPHTDDRPGARKPGDRRRARIRRRDHRPARGRRDRPTCGRAQRPGRGWRGHRRLRGSAGTGEHRSTQALLTGLLSTPACVLLQLERGGIEHSRAPPTAPRTRLCEPDGPRDPSRRRSQLRGALDGPVERDRRDPGIADLHDRHDAAERPRSQPTRSRSCGCAAARSGSRRASRSLLRGRLELRVPHRRDACDEL